MPTHQFEKGYTERGAYMGRDSYNEPPTKAKAVRLFLVVLDAYGYDNGGAYWGIGEPLWCAMAKEDSTGEEQYRDFVRAPTRRQAATLLGLGAYQLISKKDL